MSCNYGNSLSDYTSAAQNRQSIVDNRPPARWQPSRRNSGRAKPSNAKFINSPQLWETIEQRIEADIAAQESATQQSATQTSDRWLDDENVDGNLNTNTSRQADVIRSVYLDAYNPALYKRYGQKIRVDSDEGSWYSSQKQPIEYVAEYAGAHNYYGHGTRGVPEAKAVIPPNTVRELLLKWGRLPPLPV
jgi:hypothetical protein